MTTPVVVKQPFDGHHVLILAAFVFGVIRAGYPMVAMLLTKSGSTNGIGLSLGIAALVASAVGAWFKLPPGTPMLQAEQAGEEAAGEPPHV